MPSALAASLCTDDFLLQIVVVFYSWDFSGYSYVLSPHRGQLDTPRSYGPERSLLMMMVGSWCINISASLPLRWANFRACSSFLEVASLTSPRCAQPLPPFSHFALFPLALPQVSFHMNHFPSNPCFRVYY